ncbi:hypothetical protein UA08_02635 [Talaromyces atroroseus]|uniref:Calcium influx-promoting protein ehs1 n=1 Tax=Talaromyces atroroseus TaxID=1441469 RepID=A0A225AVI7_TALAT|nr:hypothetical protein UA08_02635 [Talaromyces atroroseus]OKL62384.1 hypothetical protein UA08_02635 [Talaromyces atroroseus]
MPFLKLTPLQSRFAATFAATLFLFAFYYIISTNSGSFAYALDEVDQLIMQQTGADAGVGVSNEHPVGAEWNNEIEDEIENENKEGYDGYTLKRAVTAPTALGNNQYKLLNIELGETQYWVFPKDSVLGAHTSATNELPANITDTNSTDTALSADEVNRYELRKRSSTVYISLTTCLKPSLNTSNADAAQDTQLPPLTIYISTSENNTNPGPGQDSSLQTEYTTEQGYMSATIDNADSAIYIGVSAPNTTLFTGIYNYEVAASIDAYFHSIDNDTNLYFVDSDVNAALLITNNLTQSSPDSQNYQEWMNITPPYTIFANNINNTGIAGLERSYCALSQLAQIRQGNNAVNRSMTSRGMGNKPKEQFYITYLNSSSTYYGILGLGRNSTASENGVVGGGGKIFTAMNFTTKTDNNCALLYNLDFCSEVAYAVPSNPDISNAALAQLYDSYAQSYYQSFDYSLSLIQCNTSSVNSYSLAVGCSDCASAYKQWLCAVSIPRCYDWSSNYSYLMPRDAGQPFLNGTRLPADDPLVLSPVTNQSRNPMIDSKINPGPYKEILPCYDLCSELVRTCPSALSFKCPTGKWLNDSYGHRAANGDITCSYLGAAYYLNDAFRLLSPGIDLALIISGLWMVFWVGF